MTSRRDPEAVRLAAEMEEASYQVCRTIINREWILNVDHGDYDGILAAAKAERDAARQRYIDYKQGV